MPESPQRPPVEGQPERGREPGGLRAWRARIARHPVISATLLVCTVAGAVAGVVFLSGDWSLARRIAAGAVAGAGTGLLITATKMFG